MFLLQFIIFPGVQIFLTTAATLEKLEINLCGMVTPGHLPWLLQTIASNPAPRLEVLKICFEAWHIRDCMEDFGAQVAIPLLRGLSRMSLLKKLEIGCIPLHDRNRHGPFDALSGLQTLQASP